MIEAFEEKAGVGTRLPSGTSTGGPYNPRLEDVYGKLASRVVGIDETTQAALQDVIAEGVRRGYSTDQIAHGYASEKYSGVTGVFNDASDYRAEVIARTECHPYETPVWLPASADPDLAERVAHSVVRNTKLAGDIGGGEAASVSGADCVRKRVWRTFPFASAITRAYRRWYDGPVVDIITAGGHKLTGTTNHPVLTERGWVALRELQVGDKIIKQGGTPGCSRRDPNVVGAPVQIGEVFDALAKTGLLQRVPGLSVDFHGDGRDSYVEVVWPNRDLTADLEAALAKRTRDLAFESADPALTAFASLRAKRYRNRGLGWVASVVPEQAESAIVADRDAFAFEHATQDLGSGMERPGQRHQRSAGEIASNRVLPQEAQSGPPLRRVAGGDPNALLRKNSAQTRIGDGARLHDLLDGLPGGIVVDDIVWIEVRAFSGHVYNLETVYGAYLSDDIVTHNTMAAYNSASILAYNDVGVNSVEAMDGINDPDCLERDGSVFEIDPDTGEVESENADGISSEDHPNGTLAFLPVLAEGVSAADAIGNIEAGLGPVALSSGGE